MSCPNASAACSGCPASKMLCNCLGVTEDAVLEAISAFDLRTVQEVRRHTGAGDGCTCCHGRILRCLEQTRAVTAACA